MQHKFKKKKKMLILNPKHGASNFIIEHICFLICHISPQQPDTTSELNKVTVSVHHRFHSHFKTLVRCLSEATLRLQLICEGFYFFYFFKKLMLKLKLQIDLR